jgi:exopolysaccharide biosynthesis protein
LKYYKIFITHIIELDPIELCAKLVNTTGKVISRQTKNFINCNFFSGSKTIGWLISEGKVLSERHEYKTWTGNPKGSLIVYRDETVFVGWKYDSEIIKELDKIWFCCQGFNLFPIDMDVISGIKKEGYDPNEVGRLTNRISIGYNKSTNKIVIAIRANSDSKRAISSMINLGCKDNSICLDSGGSVNFGLNGKLIFGTSRRLTNILFWN